MEGRTTSIVATINKVEGGLNGRMATSDRMEQGTRSKMVAKNNKVE